MSNQIMHPSLSQLLPLDKIPNELEAIRDALASLFDSVFVKDLIASQSYDNSSGFYSMTLTTYNSLGLDIPLAQDLKLVLNPTVDGNTEIPISFDYSWIILKYINDFNFESFDNTIESVLRILFELAEINEKTFLNELINTFYPGANALVDFVNQFNSVHTDALATLNDPNASFDNQVEHLSQQIGSLDIDLLKFAYDSLLNVGNEGLDRLKKLFARYFDNIEKNIKEALTLQFRMAINEISVGLQFPHKWLQPVYTGVENIPNLTLDQPLPDNYFSYLKFDVGNLEYSSNRGFIFNNISAFSLNRSMIGNTGLIADFSGLKVDLTRDKNIPEADADGRSSSFRGVYAEKANIKLPEKWFKKDGDTTLQLLGRHLLIGTEGGISGTIGLEALNNENPPEENDHMWFKLAKSFRVGFNKFDITFKQNRVISSNIKGAIEINKLNYPKDHPEAGKPFHVDIEGHLYDDGDFNLTASFNNANEPKANLFDLVNFDFHSFELGKQDDDYYIGTSCYVSFPENTLINKLTKGQGFDVEKLRIYSDGNIEVEGGSIPIPISLSVNLGPVQMAVSNINFGSTQINGRKYNFWGFDGAISINPLGLDARGEGVKYYYSTDDGPKESFLRIQTIEVDLMIPGTATEESAMAIIHGMISLPQPGVSPEFMGEVSLKLPKAKITGSVGMRFAPKYPAFLVDASIELPTGIPLGFISITGFRGLLGFRYIATKQAAGLTTDNSWYEFYKHPKAGINIRKFSGPPDSLQYKSPFSIGAGATFETTGGTILTLRAMLLLSLPTLFYIEAGLSVLSDRLGPIEKDQSTPPFFAMVAFGDNSLEMAAGADFQMPKAGGEIIQLHALLEAGFFFKNQKPWYINLGSKKDPIMARILTLFTAKSFLMLSAQGIEAGARLDFKLEKSFGPAKVKLWAYLEMGGKISFKRPQMGGYIAAGGGIQIKIWIINVEIVLDTIFSVESFKPFLIYAKLELSVRVKICFVRVRKTFLIELQWDINRIVDRTPYSPLPMGTYGDANDNRTAEYVKGVHMLTNEAFLLDYFTTEPANANAISKVIPLDTFIDIKMAKGVLPNKSLNKVIGGYTADAKNYTDMMPPEGTSKAGRKLRQVKHEYAIESIGLKSWDGSKWVPYHPFEAVTPVDSRGLVSNLPWAQWQKVIDQYDSIRVLATNPFSFLSAGEPGWHVPEQFGITPSKLFCISDKIEEESVNFLNKKIGKRYYVPTQYEADKINGLFFKLVGEAPEIVDGKLINGDFMSITAENNPFGYRRSLSFKNYDKLEIIFPEGAIEPSFKITTHAKTVKVSAYTSYFEKGDKLPKYKIVQIRKSNSEPVSDEVTYTKAELNSGIKLFDNVTDLALKDKIDKIIISPVAANADAILDVRNKIAALFDSAYTSADGEFTVLEPSDLDEFDRLMAVLTQLKADAGNDNPTGTSAPLTFTHFYGYNGKAVYNFDKVFKYNDTYLVSFHPQPNTTVIAQIDAKGNFVRERLLNGIVTSMQVVNNNLLLTQALDATQCKGIGEAIINDNFIVGCINPAATTAIIELDSELNKNFGMQYFNTYSTGFNKLLPLSNNELLWVNTLDKATQINWVNGTDRSIIKCLKIDDVAVKVVQHNVTDFSLITKNKKIVHFSINTTTQTISVTNTQLISDASISEIKDATIVNGKVLLTAKMSNGKFGLVQIDGTNINIIKNDTIFDSAVYLSNNTLANNAVLAYNENYLFVFNTSLALTRLIERGSTDDNATIVNIQNEPSVNEILMLSSKANEKGIYFSLFNDQFDNCSLHPATTVSVVSSASALTIGAVNSTNLTNVEKFEYTRGTRSSKLLSINNVICTAGGNSDDDPELDYTTYIQQIQWLSKESAMHNLTIPSAIEVAEDNKAMEAAIQNTVQPIWRPNTTYCLSFTLTDRVDDKDTTKFNYHYGFKTLGPVGHYPVPDPVIPVGQIAPTKNELTELSKSPLTSLRQYLDYNRSYPNADGSLLLSKPSFYGNEQCKVSLFFKNPYVSHMLKGWEPYGGKSKIDGVLNLIINDPLNDVLIPYPLPTEKTPYPKAEERNMQWVDDNDPRIPLNIKMLQNMIKGSPDLKCTIQIGSALKPKSYGYEVKLTDLKPSKLYTILAKNYFDDNENGTAAENENVLIHQFGFQTSRYRDFAEQVNSYEIDAATSRKALFDIPLNLSVDQIASLNNVIFGQTDTFSESIALKYQHLFDRAVEGILKMSPLDPAQSTEVNRIIDTNTNEVVALLVRNPEPFNIPKIPLEEIKNTVSVVDENGTKKANYQVLHSKDYSQILIMNDSKKITDTALNIRFEYRMWNNNGTVDANSTPLTVRVGEPVVLPIKNINL
ncbi:hypothetical protein [Flavobacterium aquiphilum]|uniref:hypothetical protein n=1 Tax=Flavobacterium aquiphilum TaxID=3003261 RepID=UPI002480EFF9|nr:hypothetical protein [Flavobacterium aquiphilum]